MTAEERAFNVVNKSNIKTLQARAWSVLDYFRFQHVVMSEELLAAKIVDVLKDQIEECAKVGDRYKENHWHGAEKAAASEVTREIRALATPTEEVKTNDH